jgi:hypothetical protein
LNDGGKSVNYLKREMENFANLENMGSGPLRPEGDVDMALLKRPGRLSLHSANSQSKPRMILSATGLSGLLCFADVV